MNEVARLQVVGNPIAHSWSPQIHQAFAAQFARPIRYDKTLVEIGGFADHARHFFAEGGVGMNVTVPFKEAAFEFVDVRSEAAALAGAVNTIRLEAGMTCGDNTDGIGLVNDLEQRWACELAGSSVLILGAGGSARGLLAPLAAAGVETVVLANRTVAKAELLAEMALELGMQSFARPLPVASETLDRALVNIDVVINTTSTGLQQEFDLGELCEAEVVAERICYDLSYGTKARFQQHAAARGALASYDGLGMLVEQAAESYFLWFGERPETNPVYQDLRAQSADDEAAS